MNGKAQRPRLAASLVLIDRNGPSIKVLMGRRHADHVFLADKYVFPGGRVEPQDRLMQALSQLPPIVTAKLEQRVTRPALSHARSLALAAIRETFEETGILLGEKSSQGQPAPKGTWSEFASHGIRPHLTQLKFFARAITPPGRSRRFDTYFFAAEAKDIAQRVDGMVHAQSELVETVWVELLETQKLDLMPITCSILRELSKRLAAGMDDALPVPFFYTKYKQPFREEL